ncbi:hypothetical protein BsWGS_24009 [Bradybaena similaris]
MNNKTPASVKKEVEEQHEVYVDYPGQEMVDSESLSPSKNIKLESFSNCECGNVQSPTKEIICQVQVCEKINNKTPASVKIEQPEVYADYPGEEIMGTDSQSPDNNIKLKPFYECDNVQSFTREIISEVQVFDMMDDKTSVKIEPEVYVDYADEDQKIHHCSQSCPSLQKESQMENKKMFGYIDWKHVKHEQSDLLCQKKSQIVDMASCCSIPEITGNNTESRMSKAITIIHHQEVPFIGTENGYMASKQHEHCSYLSETVTSMAEIDTKICLTDDNSQLRNVETPIKQTQISRKSLDDAPDYTRGSPQRIQAEDTACMFDNCDATINVDTFLHTQKTTDLRERHYNCDVCAASFTSTYNLKCHIRTHIGEKPYVCDICSSSFTKHHDLKRHKRTHTGEKPYVCNICSASFTKHHDLKYHKKTHTGEKPYMRDVCAASFATAGTPKAHKRTHTGEKPYMCDVCATSFTSSRSLKRHKRTHTGEKPYKCDICGASFTSADKVKIHKRTHTGEKPYKCDVCAASFTSADKLKIHKRTHTGEKPYKCDVCSASFTQVSSLNFHARTHTGEKPYRCDVCAAYFSGSSSLKRHKRIHTGEKPYKCDVCAASFTRAGILKHHRRTHTGEKPYKCDVCGASFTHAGSFKYHTRIHSRETLQV